MSFFSLLFELNVPFGQEGRQALPYNYKPLVQVKHPLLLQLEHDRGHYAQ